jgi:serine/arginine repetitive matrix protein 2
MAEHERKRALESRLLKLREALEEQGYTDAQADARIAEARKAAEEETDQSVAKEERWPKGTPL